MFDNLVPKIVPSGKNKRLRYEKVLSIFVSPLNMDGFWTSTAPLKIEDWVLRFYWKFNRKRFTNICLSWTTIGHLQIDSICASQVY